jgi:hypothetical protein
MDAREKLNGFWLIAAGLVGLVVAGVIGGGLMTILIVAGLVMFFAYKNDLVR